MLFITDAQVREHMTMNDAIAAMDSAFRAFGAGNGANLARNRANAGGRTISAMGAVLPGAGVMGAKIYPTVDGKFNFVIPLFAFDDGRLLCVMEGNALTEFRTASVTRVAAGVLATSAPNTLAIFGTGIQARAHIQAFLPTMPIKKVNVVEPMGDASAFCTWLRDTFHVEATAMTAEQAIADADIIITVTRSKTALFDGNAVRPGTFVAAIGSSKPDTREVDDALLERSACIAVEWAPQTLIETGDFMLAKPEALDRRKVVELGALLAGTTGYVRKADDVTLYKSVGIGVEDVALAELVWKRVSAAG